MKWRKAFTDGNLGMYYISENNKYSIHDEYVKVERRKKYSVGYRQKWILKNLENNNTVFEGATLKSCKAYAENL